MKKNIGRHCYVKALVPWKTAGMQDPQTFVVVNDIRGYYLVVGNDFNTTYKIRKSEVLFEDRVQNSILVGRR